MNFSSIHRIWNKCQKVWCGPCYTPPHNMDFQLLLTVADGDGVEVDGMRMKVDSPRPEIRIAFSPNSNVTYVYLESVE
jgi:hypothetical protein